MTRGQEFTGQQVAVIGLAATGLATAQVLSDLGAFVTVYDSKPEGVLDTARVTEARELKRVALALGTSEIAWGKTDLVIPSPGVPRYAPPIVEAVKRSVPVLGEIEVAYRLSQAPLLAITGTNGKTTTTAMVGAICREAGLPTWVAGNIAEDAGKRLPLIQAAVEAPPEGVIIAEISSFQLEWVEQFRPKVAAWLNLTPDHLDRHRDMDEYARAKSNLLRAQTEEDFAVLNGDDAEVMRYSEGVGRAKRLLFHQGEPLLDELLQGEPLPVPGWHNRLNAIAAAKMVLAFRPHAAAAVRAGLLGFGGVAHRMEWVGTVDGVRYINNSMCTNPAAVGASLEAAAESGPVIAIAGGKHKGGDLSGMATALATQARHIVLIGEAAPHLGDALRAVGRNEYECATTLPEAVERGRAVAQPGDTVILVPGCASFDMFTGFEHRGQVFRDTVARFMKG